MANDNPFASPSFIEVMVKNGLSKNETMSISEKKRAG